MTALRNIGAPLSLLAGLLIAGCASTPRNIDNACEIFREKPDWYEDAKESYRRWRVPIPVMMAIIHQESSFRKNARPDRVRILGFIPGPRPSDAYGYAQALQSTWELYTRATGNTSAARDDFSDAIDFVGWYCDGSSRECGISRGDAFNLYLAYHEGWKGFVARTYRDKPWLVSVAKKVSARARLYSRQLAACGDELEGE